MSDRQNNSHRGGGYNNNECGRRGYYSDDRRRDGGCSGRSYRGEGRVGYHPPPNDERIPRRPKGWRQQQHGPPRDSSGPRGGYQPQQQHSRESSNRPPSATYSGQTHPRDTTIISRNVRPKVPIASIPNNNNNSKELTAPLANWNELTRKQKADALWPGRFSQDDCDALDDYWKSKAPRMKMPDNIPQFVQEKAPDADLHAQKELVQFVTALQESDMMSHFALHGKKACSCPCARENRNWKIQFGMDAMEEMPVCSNKAYNAPGALLTHLEDKKKRGCDFHGVAYELVCFVFRYFYNAGGIGPHYMYAENNKQYKAAKGWADREEKSKQAKLLQKSRRLEIENAELLLKTKEVKSEEEQNKEARRQQTLQWLGIDTATTAEDETVTEQLKQLAQEAIQDLVTNLQDLYPIPIHSRNQAQLDLHGLQHDFKADELYAKCQQDSDDDESDDDDDGQRGFRFLFSSAAFGRKELALLVRQPNVQYEAKYSKQDEQPVDEGGPTRQLLDTLWASISEFTLRGDLRLLTDSGDGVLMLQKNEQLERLDNFAREKAKSCYRFIGRLIVITLIGAENSAIPSHFLPRIMWKYLFLGYTAENPRYDIVHLVFDFYATFPRKMFQNVNKTEQDPLHQVMDQTLDGLRQLEFLEEGRGGQPNTTEGKFRKFVNEYCIESYSIALDALLEGMRPLGHRGHVAFRFTRLLPFRALEEVCFSRKDVTAQYIIDCLRPVYLEDPGYPEARSHQEAVLRNEGTGYVGYLPDILHTMEPERLRTFVQFITGNKNVPRIGWTVTVEFNFSEYNSHKERLDQSLPSTHTCEQMLVVPGTAYAAAEDPFATLVEKLNMALDEFEATGAFTDV